MKLEDYQKAKLMLFNSSSSITVWFNDYFAPCGCDCFTLDEEDYHWALPFIGENDANAIDVVFSYILGILPLKTHQTTQFMALYQKLKELNPIVKSEQR